MGVKTMTLTLDELDYATIQREIAHRQVRSRWPVGNESPGLIDPDGPPKSGTILPDGESCLAGAILAECVRDLDEYRTLWDAEHPREDDAA
jgi:hypothetical protein